MKYQRIIIAVLADSPSFERPISIGKIAMPINPRKLKILVLLRYIYKDAKITEE